MSKLYLLGPMVMLAGFVGFERDHNRRRSEQDLHLAAEISAAKAAEAARLEDLRERAIADALLRNETRETRERESAAERLRAQIATLRAIEDKADAAAANADMIVRGTAALAQKLVALRAERDAIERKATELVRQLETQHTSRRAGETAWQEAISRFAARLHETIDSSEDPRVAPR